MSSYAADKKQERGKHAQAMIRFHVFLIEGPS